MVSLQTVEAQLERVGMKNRFFGRPEIKELCNILAPGEVVQHAVMGHYEGGLALMVATNWRVLLVDKKLWFLSLEDIRYDMISQVDFYARLLDSTVSLVTISKTLTFTSWRQGRLRELVKYIQSMVMQLRRIDDSWQSNGQYVVDDFSGAGYAYSRSSFMDAYKDRVKRRSLAQLAGHVAMMLDRGRPAVRRPLYTRPSLIARYRNYPA